MKKMLLLFAFTVILLGGYSAKAQGVVDGVCLYIPNRLIDALDTFTLNMGVGPVVRCELRGTRAVQGGGGIGATAKVIKDYNRQYGACLQNGWNWEFISVAAEDIERRPTADRSSPRRRTKAPEAWKMATVTLDVSGNRYTIEVCPMPGFGIARRPITMPEV